MCCSVLQCVAVCYSVLQCVVVCCSVLQCVENGDVYIFVNIFTYICNILICVRACLCML